MITQVYHCLFVFLLYCTIFVEVCPPRPSPKPTSRPPISSDKQTAVTNLRTTVPPSVISRKEMLFIPIKGYRLDKFSYTETRVGSIIECAHLCLRENGQCLSVNIEKALNNGGYKCELNNSTKENHVKNFLQNAAYSYFEPINAWVNGEPVSFEDINTLRN